MHQCQNCGSSVTERYVRVFEPQGVDDPRVCPHCDDMIRHGADVRENRNTNQSA